MKLFKWIGSEQEAHTILKDSRTQEEEVVCLRNNEEMLLLQETMEASIPVTETYEILDRTGALQNNCFAVLNNIPVTEEGRTQFEERFRNRAGLIEQEPGFIAIRVLRPLQSDTYVILTLWENEESFTNWQQSKAYSKAHAKRGTEQGIDKRPNLFPRASFVTTYQ